MEHLFKNQPVLEHSGLRLLPMQAPHANDLLVINHSSIWDFMFQPINSLEDMQKWVKAAVIGRENNLMLPFVVQQKVTNQIIGSTRIYNLDFDNRACEIGHTWYSPHFQRSFVNTACKLTLLQFCFEELNMIRVQFKTDERNIRSQKAIERIGAQKEGILRNERILENGYIRNACVYSITSQEWPEVKKGLIKKEEHNHKGAE